MLILSIKNGGNKKIVPLAARWDRPIPHSAILALSLRDIAVLRNEERINDGRTKKVKRKGFNEARRDYLQSVAEIFFKS